MRTVVSRQPGHTLEEVAEALAIPREGFRRLVMDREHTIDAALLIDVVAAMVHVLAVDPTWLLTGTYDPSLHRQALLLAEDRATAARGIRELVEGQYRRLRDDALASVWLVHGEHSSKLADR